MSSFTTGKSSAYSGDEWKTVTGRPKYSKSDKQSQPKKLVDKEKEKPPVFLNMKMIKLDVNNTTIHPKVYNYIVNLLSCCDDNDVIYKTITIGINQTDKIMALAQLFFVCVRRDKISIMQKIMDHPIVTNSDSTKHFIVNAYDRGYTPVMRAAYVGSSKAIKLLLHWGADPNPINIDGENIFDALNAGLRDAIKANPLLEIFERPKFEEIRTFLTNLHLNEEVKLDTHDPILEQLHKPIETNNTDNTCKQITLSVLDIDGEVSIESQIDNTLISAVEDYNINLLSRLFSDIKELLNEGHLEKSIINDIIDNYRDILEDEFPEEYAQLNV